MATPRSFFSMLAHELRNSLAPMRNGVQLLRLRGATDSAVLAAADIVDRQIANIIKLLEIAVDADQIRRGETTLALQPADYAQMVNEAVATQKELIAQRRIQLQLALPQAPAQVLADVARLKQAIANLIEHAVLTATEGSVVSVAGSVGEKDANLRIRNDAKDAGGEQMASIFEFESLGSVRTKGTAGLNVGPAVARAIVDMHRGQVSVSAHASGMELSLKVPLADATAANASPDNVAQSAAQLSGATPSVTANAQARARRRILIADDSAAVRASLSGLLAEMGHEVQEAVDGTEAVEIAQSWRPDFVLLDVNMPRLNGVEAARRLRAEFPAPGMRLVMMSGNNLDAATLGAAKDAGFDHCVDKVFDFDALDKVLAS